MSEFKAPFTIHHMSAGGMYPEPAIEVTRGFDYENGSDDGHKMSFVRAKNETSAVLKWLRNPGEKVLPGTPVGTDDGIIGTVLKCDENGAKFSLIRPNGAAKIIQLTNQVA